MWVWSKLSSIKWMDAWEDRFYGNPNTVISRLKTNKTIRVEVYTDTEKEALEIKKQFGGSIRKLVHQNWAAIKPPNRKPIRIRSSLIISSEDGQKARAKLHKQFPSRHIIQIPADMAFGTGDHATTSTCMRLLVDAAKNKPSGSWNMLDLGCGTGVLAIAARMLGADSCYAIDFDPKAIEVAKRNLTRNEVDGITAVVQDVLRWNPKGKWDIVIANLFSTILQEAFDTIVKTLKKDSTLIVSGILADQWIETKNKAKKAGLVFPTVIQKGKWVTASTEKF